MSQTQESKRRAILVGVTVHMNETPSPVASPESRQAEPFCSSQPVPRNCAPVSGRAWHVSSPAQDGRVGLVEFVKGDKDVRLRDPAKRPIAVLVPHGAELLVDHKQEVIVGQPIYRLHEAAEWAAPRPLTEAHGPDFPVEALSPWHRRYVEELADQVRMVPDGPAVFTLGTIAAAASKTAFVWVPPGDLFPLNLNVSVISPSGDGKTPALVETRRPLDIYQGEARAEARSRIGRLRVRHRIAKGDIRELERQARDLPPEEREPLEAQIAALEEEMELEAAEAKPPTLTTGDPSQAGLVWLMAANQGRILLISDEGDQLFSRIQQRSPAGAEDIEAMLQSYSGAPLERDLAGGKSVRIATPALSIVTGIQPGPFAKVMACRAYHDKGLLARFLWAVLPSQKGRRKQRPKGLSDEAKRDYETRVRALLGRQVLDNQDCPRLVLSEPAMQLFCDFGAEVDGSLVDGDLADLHVWGNKLRGATARIAGVLHLADHALEEDAESTISENTMGRAIQIAGYFRSHAIVAFRDAVQSATDENARKVLKWVVGSKKPRIKLSEVVRVKSGALLGKEVEIALVQLVEDGYLREVPTPRKGTTGRRPKPSYLVNPCLFRKP